MSLADYSSFAISNIGVHFSMDTIKGKYWELVELEPSYENPPNNILRDSVNWMVINGTYDASGGEQFMTIGNFRSNENTNVDTLKDYADGKAGYLIDDIAVWEDGAISYPANAGNDRAVCAIDGDSVALGTSNYDDYFYEWTPSEGLNNPTTGRPMAKPTTTTMYYLKQKDFKFDITIDSVLILISDRCDTIVSIDNGELIIDNELSVFPNPASDKLYIKTNRTVRSLNIEVYDIYGKILINNGEWKINNGVSAVNINHLDRGIYFVKVNGVTLKFVKL